MKIGVLLPTFRGGSADALDFAAQAAAARIDGVFAYDHLWPMGAPQRPSLAPFPLLAAVARRHEHLVVAPLVARVGLVGTGHLVNEFQTLLALAPGRVIAALGTGDRLSALENEAYGLEARSAAERRQLLHAAAALLGPSMPVWVGAGSTQTNELARSLGAEINVWDSPASAVAVLSASGPVNWAGPVPSDLSSTLNALSDAGSTWAVLGPEVNIADLAEWRRAH